MAADTTTPTTLRSAASVSYAWRKDGQSITEIQYDAMPEVTKEQAAAKAKWRWGSDPKLVAQLVAGERAWVA